MVSKTTSWRKGYVDGAFGQVHFQAIGDGPAIIMHHQAPADGNGFRRAAPLIAAAGYRAILVDMPGFGMSDRPDHPPSVEELADAAFAVASQAVEGKAVLLGHHTGAMMATEAATRDPDLFRAVILYAPLIFTPEDVAAWRTNVVERERSFELKSDGSHYGDVWDYVAGFIADVRDLESLHWIVEAAVRAGPYHWYAHNACLNYDAERTLRLLDAGDLPAVIITNSGDPCAPMANRAVAACRRIRHVALEGGSIDFANEHPEPWAGAVIDFMKTLPS